MADPRIDPKPVPPVVDPIDAAQDTRQEYPVVDSSGWGSGIALFALLVIAVMSLIWLFSGPNQPVQNTAQNDTAVTQRVQPTQPEQPAQPTQPEAQPQPEQQPPAGNNTTQP